MKKYIFILFLFLLAVSCNGGANEELVLPKQKVNKTLLKFHQDRFSKPTLVEVTKNVTTAFAYEYSNFSFIEGKDGVIVIDAGWYQDASKRALEDYQKKVSKPIKAIIYTHLHTDHFGGSQVFTNTTNEKIEVIAPKGWRNWINYSISPMRDMVVKRALSQMGILLPESEDGTVGAGVGKSPRMKGGIGLAVPTRIIASKTEIEIAGIRLVLIPSPGDLKDNMMIWLPKEKVLFTGDVLGGVFPYIATARFEIEREPIDFIESIDRSLALNPEKLVSGHGRVLFGEEVDEVLQSTRDVIQFMINQMDRLVNKGLTVDEIITELKIPENLAKHPDLQTHYHRLEWIIKQMFIKRAGFFNTENDLVKLTNIEENKRLIKLLGSKENVLKHARTAFNNKEYRWASSLASKVLSVSKNNEEALQIQNASFKAISAKTLSANERNYLLTKVKEYEQNFDWNKILIPEKLRTMSKVTNTKIISLLPAKFKAEDAGDTALLINFKVGKELFNLQIRNGVLTDNITNAKKADVVLQFSHQTLVKVYSGKYSWLEAFEQGDINITEGEKFARTFFSLMD